MLFSDDDDILVGGVEFFLEAGVGVGVGVGITLGLCRETIVGKL
jgi:hypothetical protein